jgi:hemolysin III
VAVWALGVATMLGVSATYHSGRFGPVGMRRLKRIDHSTILLAIAGSYTAFATLALDGAAQARLLTFVWVAAGVGVAIRLAWLHAPYPVVALVYVAVGWGALLEWGALAGALGTAQFALLLGGGLLYTLGAGVYAAHRPNPWPATFGYHEVFHALVVGGVTLHLVAVATLVTGT